MAENKKSFLLFTELIEVVELMSDETAGKFFKHILQYVNDLNPETKNNEVLLSFIPVKQNLKRQLIKWEEIKKKRSIAGQISAEKKKHNLTKSTHVEFVEHNLTKSTVNDNVNDNVNVNVNVNDNVNNIDSRKLKFSTSLKPFLEIYGKDLLDNFYNYWIEENKSKTKLKFELEKTWNVEFRLKRWSNNEINFKKNNYGKDKANLQSRKLTVDEQIAKLKSDSEERLRIEIESQQY